MTATTSFAAGCWASPKDCIDPVLCHFASGYNSTLKKKIWKLSKPSHVKEAKRRGLSCGGAQNVGANGRILPSWNVNQYLLKEFKSLSSEDRILIQSELKEKGYYKSSLDGLYGPGTQKALVAFRKAEFPELGLLKNGSAEELLLKMIARSEQTGAETQTAEYPNNF